MARRGFVMMECGCMYGGDVCAGGSAHAVCHNERDGVVPDFVAGHHAAACCAEGGTAHTVVARYGGCWRLGRNQAG